MKYVDGRQTGVRVTEAGVDFQGLVKQPPGFGVSFSRPSMLRARQDFGAGHSDQRQGVFRVNLQRSLKVLNRGLQSIWRELVKVIDALAVEQVSFGICRVALGEALIL